MKQWGIMNLGLGIILQNVADRKLMMKQVMRLFVGASMVLYH